jgi:hypothetical protein
MHVSDKLAFHLGDSFYTAIKSVDVVALETNLRTGRMTSANQFFIKVRTNFNSMGRYSFMNDRAPATCFALLHLPLMIMRKP